MVVAILKPGQPGNRVHICCDAVDFSMVVMAPSAVNICRRRAGFSIMTQGSAQRFCLQLDALDFGGSKPVEIVAKLGFHAGY